MQKIDGSSEKSLILLRKRKELKLDFTFKAPDFDFIAEQLSETIIFDGRNLFEPDRMAKKGFIYYSIGRNPNFVDFEIQSRSKSLVLECA